MECAHGMQIICAHEERQIDADTLMDGVGSQCREQRAVVMIRGSKDTCSLMEKCVE